jgi:hypothetical protein
MTITLVSNQRLTYYYPLVRTVLGQALVATSLMFGVMALYGISSMSYLSMATP